MVRVTYLRPGEPAPLERHVAVIVHREGGGTDKAYFYDTAKNDYGGSGPFDWLLNEAIERAKSFARERQLENVVVRARRSD